MEAAKCQETLKNNVPQANSLVKAGTLFLGAWETEKHFTHNNNDSFSNNDDKSDATHLFGNLEVGARMRS